MASDFSAMSTRWMCKFASHKIFEEDEDDEDGKKTRTKAIFTLSSKSMLNWQSENDKFSIRK